MKHKIGDEFKIMDGMVHKVYRIIIVNNDLQTYYIQEVHSGMEVTEEWLDMVTK